MTFDVQNSSLHQCPHAFIDKKGDPILISLLEQRHDDLLRMYLNFEPRNCFGGLPPIRDEDCTRWVRQMTDTALNLIAISFRDGLIGHAALFPMLKRMCEFMVVVHQKYQCIGIGSQLTRCAIQLAHEAGFENIWLCVEAGNHIARHVYSKSGFVYRTRSTVDDIEMTFDLAIYNRMLSARVDEVMNTNVLSIDERKTCRDAVAVFLHHHIASLPVVNRQQKVVGIISETDLIAATNLNQRISEVLTKEVVTVHPDSRIGPVVRLFQEKRLRYIPVVNEKRRLLGIVGRRDVLAHYSRALASNSEGP